MLFRSGKRIRKRPNRKSAPIRCKSRGRELFCHAQLSPPCSRVYSRHLTCRYCALPQHTTPLASAFRSVGSCYFNMCSLFPSLFKSPRKLTHLFCPVSYTHLDVYKRQVLDCSYLCKSCSPHSASVCFHDRLLPFRISR